jgi:hypothetical protein
MSAPALSELDDQTTSQFNDTPLNVNLLKEIARKALVDALNSVCPPERCLAIG